MYEIRNEETGHAKAFETKEAVAEFLSGVDNPHIYSGWQACGIVLNTQEAEDLETKFEDGFNEEEIEE